LSGIVILSRISVFVDIVRPEWICDLNRSTIINFAGYLFTAPGRRSSADDCDRLRLLPLIIELNARVRADHILILEIHLILVIS
jgi:hypothetical protein